MLNHVIQGAFACSLMLHPWLLLLTCVNGFLSESHLYWTYVRPQKQPIIRITIPDEVLDILANLMGISELLALIQCKRRMKSNWGCLAANYKTDSKLCIYKTYDQWKVLEKRELKESATRLLLKNQEFYPYRKFLLEGESFDPAEVELPSRLITNEIIQKLGLFLPIRLWAMKKYFLQWPLFFGENITITAVNLVFDHLIMDEALPDFVDLAISAHCSNMNLQVLRHFIVKIALKTNITTAEYLEKFKEVLDRDRYYPRAISQQYLYAADELGIRYTALHNAPKKALEWLKLDDIELSTTFVSIFRSKSIIKACADHIGKQQFQQILTHKPVAWCTTAGVFQAAVDLASNEPNLLVFLHRLPVSQKFSCDKKWLSKTVKRLFDEQYSERAFADLIRHLNDPQFTVDAIAPIVSSFMFEEPWDMKILLPIFKATPNLSLDFNQFKQLAADRVEEDVLCLAMFTKKDFPFICDLLEMGLPSSFICLLILLYSRDFTENAVDADEVERLISLAEDKGYTNEDGLFDLFREHPVIPHPADRPSEISLADELIFTISSAHLSSMLLAIQKLPKEHIFNLIMYDPDRWWDGAEAMKLVTSVLDAAAMSKFLDRLSRRIDKVISPESMECVWPLIEQDHKILSKLLYKFPHTKFELAFIRKYRASFRALPHHLKLKIIWENKRIDPAFPADPNLPIHLAMAYALIVSKKPVQIEEYLKKRNAPDSFIKLYALWWDIQITEVNSQQLDQNLSESTK